MLSAFAYEPIAIIGIGCRFPGKIISPKTFWEFLVDKGDATRDVPADRWSIEKYYDENPERIAAIYTRRGAFIDDITGFDPAFFGISPREAACVDPQHRLLLETTWEAFEDAGIAPGAWAGRKVGVFVGLFTHDFENIHMRISERGLYGPHSATGTSTTIAANRISHAFDFKGPSMIIDTACSSSLVAMHLACRSLQAGEADLAVAGGVNLQLTPEMTMALCQAAMLAPDGRCKSFDARANGYARADGAGMVVLKPLSRAQQDGDSIYALIVGSAVNQDGRTKGITVPNGESQQIAMRAALDCAGVDPTRISYVEAHGTGTPVGDPIEADALNSVLTSISPMRDACVIGSVKSNFGHTESAAGVAGLIKVALMQRHGRIPANLHFETPNPNIPWDRMRLRVPSVLEEWTADHDGSRLAGVNSFGFGGTNAHLVVANAPAKATRDTPPRAAERPVLYCLSARSEAALLASARQHAEYLRSLANDGSLEPVAAQLALCREHHSCRMVAAGRSDREIVDLLDGFVAGRRRSALSTGWATGPKAPAVVFVCSGMGQQWWAMGRGLIKSEPVFAAKIAEIDRLFARLDANWSLREILGADEASSRIDRTQNAQPAIFAVQVALAALWETWGVRPDFVVGHSVGEVAASCISGALSLEDAVTVSFHRSRLQATLAGRGGMLAVGLPATQARARVSDVTALVSIAAVNSPNNVTLAGDIDALDRLAKSLEREGIFARPLNVELPYHSPVMGEISAPFKAAIREITARPTSIPLVSTVTGDEIEGQSLNADYWNRNICESVAFADAIRTLTRLNGRLFVELGAHPVLASSIEECLAASDVQGTAIGSLRRNQDDMTTVLSALGQLHCHGYEVDFTRHFARSTSRLDLPTYPWQRTRFWTESAESRKIRTGLSHDGAEPDHPLLGERLSSPQPIWTSQISPQRPAYLNDHRLRDSVVFPGAGFIEMALAAAKGSDPAASPITIERLSIETPLVLGRDGPTRLQISIGTDRRLEIHSLSQQDQDRRWTRHASCSLGEVAPPCEPPSLDRTVLDGRLQILQNSEDIYRRLDALGLHYGPQFRILDAAWCDQDEALGQIAVTPEIAAEAGRYNVHPALLDASFQLLAALPSEGTYLPTSIERIDVYRPGAAATWAYARRVSQSRMRVVADICLADEDGQIVAAVTRLTCKLFENARSSGRTQSGTFLYESVWIEAMRADASQPSFLGSLAPFASALQERHDRRNVEIDRQKYVLESLPALDFVATAYFIDALKALGCDWQRSDTFTAEQMSCDLGISPRHVRYVDRMLEHLARLGCVARTDGHWRMLERPSGPGAAVLWSAAVLAHPDCHAELSLIQRCGSQLAAFLRDEDEPLSALFPVGSPVAEHLYSDSPSARPYNCIVADAVVHILRHLPPGEKLRILEAGAGTGGLACGLLPLLPPERTEYVFTDISHAFINQAKARFRTFPFVRYESFDIERDACDQGFSEGSCDLVIASDAVHATADLRTTLANLRRLLAPGGILMLVEITDPPCHCDFVFGLFPGWWAFSDKDLRPHHATLPASGWRSVLAACGYDAISDIGDRIDNTSSFQSVVLARKPDDAGGPRSNPDASPTVEFRLDRRSPVFLLADEGHVAQSLADELESHGYLAIAVPPTASGSAWLFELSGQSNPNEPGSNAMAPVVVDLRSTGTPESRADADRPSTRATTACANLQKLVGALCGQAWQGKPDLWVVTNATQAIGGLTWLALDQAPVRGFARVVKNEHAELNTYLVDLSPDPQDVEIAALAREILARGDEDEIALRGERKFVNRVVPHRNLQDARAANFATIVEQQSSGGRFIFRDVAEKAPGRGHVQVRICATGLNYKDFVWQIGLLEPPSEGLGMEAAGIITAVGEDVDHLAPGDAVMGLFKGGLSSPVEADARLLARKPPGLSFEDAAGIPIVFLSAYQALKRQARLGAGETVLIHTAAGGLGLAALQVARSLGANVMATAGNEEKRRYLRSLGVDYVGDSRSSAYAEEILALTDGRGVDVVFNTLPAGMNAHNVRLLRPGTGRLIDMRNMHYGAQLEYRLLQTGIMFSSFDLNVLIDADFDYAAELLREVVSLFERRVLRPVPYRHTPLDRAAETVNAFRRSAHIGKFIVSPADSAIDIVPSAGRMKLKENSSYLVAGGLSGFGLATARWLADMGARHLVLAGRRGAETPDATAVLVDLRRRGVEVDAVAADMADAEQMRSIIARFGREAPPLRGVVHSAMVLSDGAIKDLDAERIKSVLVPKLDVAWNLHRLTLGLPLDFFILHSSMSALLGNRDQANYAAANEYLDALARYRRANGLPALAIAWGVIGGTGYVSRDEQVRDVFARQGVLEIGLDQAWAAMAHGVETGAANLCAAIFDWSRLRQYFRVVNTSPRFSQVAAETAAGGRTDETNGGRERADLSAFATPEERRRHLEAVIVREVAAVLGAVPESLELDRPLAGLGFDSLMAAELIVAIEQATGYGFSRMALLRQDVTTAELVTEVETAMNGKLATAAPAPREDMVGDLKIENLSDSEVEGMLRKIGTGELSDA